MYGDWQAAGKISIVCNQYFESIILIQINSGRVINRLMGGGGGALLFFAIFENLKY